MNVLYLADPGSIHDVKWISYFVDKNLVRAFILPRRHHLRPSVAIPTAAEQVGSIPDFSIVRFYRTFFTALQIKSVIEKNRIDLVHILYAEPNALWCLFRSYFSVPMIVTCRGTDVLRTIPEAFEKRNLINQFVRPAYRYAFKNADWVTCTSENQIANVQHLLRRATNISIIRTGVDLNTLNLDDGIRLPFLQGKKYILFPRFIKPIYNHEFALEAISLLPPEIKANYAMVFLGHGSGEAEYQKFLCEKMNGMKDVTFLFLERQGQENLIKLYKNASLVVMTPKSDGSPVSAMEAMLAGAKLILGPLEYDKEIFSEASCILKKWDCNELAGAMTSLVLDASKFKLSQKVEVLMDREYNMAALHSLYKKMVDK